MNIFTKLQDLFDKPDIEELAAYQHKMPQSIGVDVSYDEKTGYYTARITKLNDKKLSNKTLLVTESKSRKELVNMVNDLVLTYLDFPERIKHSVPQLLPVDLDFDSKKAKQRQLVFAK